MDLSSRAVARFRQQQLVVANPPLGKARLWRLYLAYCEAGFAERRIGDYQLLLAKPGYRARRQVHSPAVG